LSSRREVWEAQRAAGLAEQERLAFQAELTECRNALLLRERGEVSGRPDDAGSCREPPSRLQVARSDYVTTRGSRTRPDTIATARRSRIQRKPEPVPGTGGVFR